MSVQSISINAKMLKSFDFSSLSTLCELTMQKIPNRVVFCKKSTNVIANPKSALNMLNLNLIGGDDLEIIILGETERELEKTQRELKEIFSSFIKF